MSRVYIAGPMTGLPEFNYPAFHAADKALTAAGHETLNPANNPECDSWLGYMRAGLTQLAQADGVAYLPGWQSSRGALIEVDLAGQLGFDVRPLAAWLDTEDAL